ncbi:site-2 protease family protein [Caproiciproducens sp. MSJ-32]|uniref:site-2 protease family protein n=1 Tax=Caproiciproducens sp. MSJ-32 TaxID=2841527 RepID=UPI001C0F92DC|nr:site-2 protease family protein [Caproiciproducens sp. MSJ-32]MBU5455099.1 site-2 protease family protein [Caproiciproducens sp. MSJ-32]
MNNYLLQKVLVIPGILIAFTAQGYAKAKMADKLGDKTPRFQGRLSLNPLDHIDIIGFIMILIANFGWTKPVETNPSAYKNGYKDAVKVTYASLFSTLIVAFIFSLIFTLWLKLGIYLNVSSFMIITYALKFIIEININLFIFNLLPLPGLACFDLFRYLSPRNFYKYSGMIYDYQLYILIAFVVLGKYVLAIPSGLIEGLFLKIAGLFFGMI